MTAKYVFLSILTVVLCILILSSGWFYWYEIRPSQIRRGCNQWAESTAKEMFVSKNEIIKSSGQKQGADARLYEEASVRGMYLKDDYREYYEQCLRSNGLR
jgi:hypothetical protein